MTMLSTNQAPLARTGITTSRSWQAWVLACVIGELFGFIAPALAGVLIVRGTGGLPPTLAALATLVVVVLAGSIEGATLGIAQWFVMRRIVPAIPWQSWTGATALAAAVAWVMGMLPNTLADIFQLSAVPFIVLWVLVAPVLLCSIGLAQWYVLRQHRTGGRWWVWYTAVGWMIGVLATFGGASFITETMPIWLATVIGVGSAVLMGLVAGAISGLGVVRLVRDQAGSLC